MSSEQTPMSPLYQPTSPLEGLLFSPIYRPTSPLGRCAWGSERFPDSFHLNCPHPNCPGVLAPGHQVEETFAPIDPGVQPLATFHYEGCHTEGNPFNFVSYPISCDLNDGCPPEVPYHQDASSVLEAQAQVIQHKVYHGGLVDLYQKRQIQALKKEIEELKVANQQLAQVGIKMWVSNTIVRWDLEHFIGAHYFSLLQSLGKTLLGACPEGELRSGVPLPPPSPLSLPLRNPSPQPSSSLGLLAEDCPPSELTTSLWGQSTSRVQRSRPSNPYVALHFDLQRSLRRKMDRNLDIFEQVFHSVVREYWEGREHDVLGCQACFNVGGYCRKSCYNALHPFHRCPPCLDCSCDKLQASLCHESLVQF